MIMSNYEMRISWMIIEKLGVKLYDTAADAVCELISNSYDADAENVTVEIPLGVYLDQKKHDENEEEYEIIVQDDGHGMSADDINRFFLVVGLERRIDNNRKNTNVINTKDEKAGSISLKYKRHVLGRKGIGKLAPFGICNEIEIWSTGKKGEDGRYPISHLILNYEEIKNHKEEKYLPTLGTDDEKYSDISGTKITLKKFNHRKASNPEIFRRQIARKFSLSVPNFKITIKDTKSGKIYEISEIDLDILEDTKINIYEIIDDNMKLLVWGWVAYTKQSYNYSELAGIRVYAHGKLATVTRDFGIKAGFTGEHSIRSYMVGEIHADWLDKEEDLITSDRQDIIWSSEKGQIFQSWGQTLMRKLGKQSVNSLRKRNYELFMDKSNYEKEAKKIFGDTSVFKSAIEVGKSIGQTFARENLNDRTYVERIRDLCFMLAPHTTVVDTLKKISEAKDIELAKLNTLFETVALAETFSYGQIAQQRINAIETFEDKIKLNPVVLEDDLQDLLEHCPWLIKSEWSLIQANRALNHFKESFKFWCSQHQKSFDSNIKLEGNTRPDFIMAFANIIEIIEIKRPSRKLDDNSFDSLFNYYDIMKEYINDNSTSGFTKIHITLICDQILLNRKNNDHLKKMENSGDLIRKDWMTMLEQVKQANEDFLSFKDKLIETSLHKIETNK